MTLMSVTAYHSFGGEVEASSTPTIRRLTPSCRHQLLRIALPNSAGSGLIYVIRQQPRRQETLRYKFCSGVGDARDIFALRQPLSRFQKPQPCPRLRNGLTLVSNPIAVHVNELASPVDRL